MMLAPEHHHHASSIFLRKQPFRTELVQLVRQLTPPQDRQGELAEAKLDRVVETGLVSAAFLDTPQVREALSRLERDLMRTAKDAQSVRTARAFADAGMLLSYWRVIPAPQGDRMAAWHSPGELMGRGGAPADDTHAGMSGRGAIAGLAPEVAGKILAAWNELSRAWRFQDAPAASSAATTLAGLLRQVNPAIYPSTGRLDWETWYQRNYKMTWVWIIYMGALPFLLMAIVYKGAWARRIGLALFLGGFALHTFAIGLRWYLAGRIPNANMFEAITASAWLGAAVALILEVILRRFPLKNLAALSASTYAMLAMMIGYFQPVVMGGASIDNDITTVMPVLDRTIWLYIHTNMIIASYALIFFGSVTALIWLGMYLASTYSSSTSLRTIWAGDGDLEARAGGAASLMLRSGGFAGQGNAGLSKSLDGATMIFMELAFLTLLVGTVLGAVWADVSWGRPWGWDPKEVFALNTWLVFLVLVHIRIKVRDKAFWTAVIAVIGCLVMLFNWLCVNFAIVGLHSYA
jgi:cytochrome c-type biogenesis protein CcsB